MLLGWGSAVEGRAGDLVTATHVINQLKPGTVMRMEKLFDTLERAASATKTWSGADLDDAMQRELFSLIAFCEKANVTVGLRTNLTQVGTFDVSVIQFRDPPQSSRRLEHGRKIASADTCRRSVHVNGRVCL